MFLSDKNEGIHARWFARFRKKGFRCVFDASLAGFLLKISNIDEFCEEDEGEDEAEPEDGKETGREGDDARDGEERLPMILMVEPQMTKEFPKIFATKEPFTMYFGNNVRLSVCLSVCVCVCVWHANL